MAKRFEIEVSAPAIRDPKQETKSYVVPDPKNWEAYYTDAAKPIVFGIDFASQMTGRATLNKGIEIVKGAPPTRLEVNRHLLTYLESDRNIHLRVVREWDDAAPETAAAAPAVQQFNPPKEKKTRPSKRA